MSDIKRFADLFKARRSLCFSFDTLSIFYIIIARFSMMCGSDDKNYFIQGLFSNYVILRVREK